MPKLLGFKEGAYDFELSLEQNDNFGLPRRRSTLTYYVLGDDLSQNQYMILSTTPGLPILGEEILNEKAVRFRAKEANRVRHPITGLPCGLWEILVETDNTINVSTFGSIPSSGERADPTNFNPVYKWRSETTKRQVFQEVELTGQPGLPNIPRQLRTTAGEIIPHEQKVPLPVLEIARYEIAPFNPLTIFNYQNHVNDLPFRGAPRGTAYMEDIVAEEEVIEGITWIKATYVIIFWIEFNADGTMKPNTWNFRPLNQGTIHRIDAPGIQTQKAVDGDGNGIVVNLDNQGFILGDNDQPVFLDFKAIPFANYNDLTL